MKRNKKIALFHATLPIVLMISVFLVGCSSDDCTIGGKGEPHLVLTYIPPYGTQEDLHGQVTHVCPDDYRIVVYIFVSNGWWVKPTDSNPKTIINKDGGWVCDITTGGQDSQATKMAAYLIPNGYSPPILLGEPVLPIELGQNAVAHAAAERTP